MRLPRRIDAVPDKRPALTAITSPIPTFPVIPLLLTPSLCDTGAIRWARDNVSRYGGNHEDLVLVGHSAGAHLAALCLADPRWLQEAGVAISPPTSSLVASTATSEPSSPSPPITPQEQAPTAPPTKPYYSGGDIAQAHSGSTASPGALPSTGGQPIVVPVRFSGFVGISGVYDVPRMAGNVIGAVLARTAFGEDRRAWKKASPVHCVRAAVAASRSSKTEGVTNGATSRESSAGRLSEDLRGGGAPPPPSKAMTTQGTPDGAPADVGVEGIAGAAIVSGSAAGHKAGGSVAKGDISTCPLLQTQVLLVTTSSDFHLKDDAEALAEALEEARLPRDECTVENREGDETVRRDTAPRVRPGGLGPPSGSGGEQGGAVDVLRARGGEDASGGGGGGVRHVFLEGEDHLSTIVSFGEPGMQASDTVLGFILGLPPPPPRA